jgi:hypothetical protein
LLRAASAIATASITRSCGATRTDRGYRFHERRVWR